MMQLAHVEWVGDAVAVVVEVAMVVSICVACPEVGIRHGLDKVAGLEVEGGGGNEKR